MFRVAIQRGGIFFRQNDSLWCTTGWFLLGGKLLNHRPFPPATRGSALSNMHMSDSEKFIYTIQSAQKPDPGGSALSAICTSATRQRHPVQRHRLYTDAHFGLGSPPASGLAQDGEAHGHVHPWRGMAIIGQPGRGFVPDK